MSVTIVGSYFASMSDFRDNFRKISVIDEEGKLNEKVWEEMCRKIANDGADATRQIPWWSIRKEDYRWMPFVYENGTYDLRFFNPLYFYNLRRMAEIANSFNLTFIFSLYDHCHTKTKNNLRRFNPWTNNRQRLKNSFYGKNMDHHRKNWESEVFKALEGLRVQYEICNEPYGDCSRFIMKTLEHLEENGVSQNDIICGLQYRLDRRTNTQYKELMKTIKRKHGLYYAEQLGKTWLLAVHQFGPHCFEGLASHETWGMRFFLSDDGNVPKNTEEWFYLHYSGYFREYPHTAFRDRFYIECMFKTANDDFSATRGVSRALIDTKGFYPKNWGKFPANRIDPEKVKLDRFHVKALKEFGKQITAQITGAVMGFIRRLESR